MGNEQVTEVKRVGRVCVSFLEILGLLGLDGHEISLCTTAPDRTWPYERQLNLTVEGPLMPKVQQGEIIPRVELIYGPLEEGTPRVIGIR